MSFDQEEEINEEEPRAVAMIARRELFDRIWSKPMTTNASELNSLAKADWSILK